MSHPLPEVAVPENQPATLPCTAEEPQGAYMLEWEKEGRGVIINGFPGSSFHVTKEYEERVQTLADNSLRIHKVTVDDKGKYKCVLRLTTKRTGHPTGRARLVVYTLPKFVATPPSDLYRTKGQSLSLRCDADSVPPPTIHWLKDSRAISSSQAETVSEGQLRVERLEEGQGPINYTCVATNKVGSSKHTSTLWFAKSAWIESPPRNKSALEGSTVVWPCRARANPDTVQYDWLYGERPIRLAEGLGLRAEVQGGALTINPVKRADSGWYTCSATNGFGQPATASAYLDIKYAAEVSSLTESIQYASLGLTAEIRCQIDANPSVHYVKWAKGAKKSLLNYLNSSKYVIAENGAVLKIRTVTRDDEDVYTCEPSNNIGSGQDFEIHLFVKEPPFFTTPFPQPEFRVKVGETVSSRCGGSGTPTPDVFWRRRNGKQVPFEKGEHEAILTLIVAPEDHGVYECVVKNMYAELVKDTSVIVYDTPPQPPEKVSVLMTAFEANVSWKPGYNGGHEQSFTIFYGSERKTGARWDTVDTGRNISHTVPRLHPDTMYHFYVQPRNTRGQGRKSETILAKTKGASAIGSIPPTDSTGVTYFPEIEKAVGLRPGTPTKLRIEKRNHQLLFTWDPPVNSPARVFHYSLQYAHVKPAPSANTKPSNSREEFNTLKEHIKETRLLISPPKPAPNVFLEPGQTYDFRVKAHSLSSSSLPSNSVAFKIPGISPQFAIIASILGGLLFLLLFLVLGCFLMRRAKRKRRESYDNKTYAQSNGSALNGGLMTGYTSDSVDMPLGCPKQGERAGPAHARGKGVTGLANRLSDLLPLGQSTPKLHRNNDSSEGFSRDTDLTTLSANQSLTRAVAKHNSNFSQYLRETNGTPNLRRAIDADASVDSVGGLLKNFQTNSWNRRHVSFDAPPQVQFEPMGETGYIFKTESSGYDRDRLLGTITKLRQTPASLSTSLPVYPAHKNVGITRPRPRIESNSSTSSGHSVPHAGLAHKFLLTTLPENGPLSSSSSGFSSQSDKETFPSAVTEMLRDKYIPPVENEVDEADERRFQRLREEFYLRRHFPKADSVSRAVVESDVL